MKVEVERVWFKAVAYRILGFCMDGLVDVCK